VFATGKVNHHGLPSVERVYLPRFCNLDGQSEEFLRGYGIQGEVQVLAGGAAVCSLGVFGEVLPYFENAVELDETIKDTVGLPVPRITFKYQDNEQRMAQHSAQALREILEAMEFRPSIVQDTVLTPGTRAHELGGARMGASPRTSVLNTYNQCWDIPNLFVTDGACFPSASDKGPTLTMMALTRRTCEYILYQLKTGHL
jgi:choline dehydrogenase-like flavoprotein